MFSLWHSLRWRLQAWHALILSLVIFGFGLAIYREIDFSQWKRVDDDLLVAGRLLEGSLRSVPRPILESIAQDLGQPRGPRFIPPGPPGRDHRAPPNRNLPPRNPPPRDMPPRDMPPRGDYPGTRNDNGLPREDRTRSPMQIPWDTEIEHAVEAMSQEEWESTLSLPRALPEQMGHRDSPVYFILWREDGTVFRESLVPEERPSIPENLEEHFHRNRYLRRQRGSFHEIFIRGPHRMLIGVGRSIVDERSRLRQLAFMLISTGTSIFAIGMLGGWWLSRRAIAPIQRMSETAQKIQSNTLSQRVDINGFDTEFAQLGAVLNSMLDRLNNAFEQQRRFVADASHELRTPLSVIMTSTELALSKERGPEEYRMQLETCQRSANRMHQLVESLLMLARLDGKQSLESLREVDLAALVEENLQWLEPLASERHVQLLANLQSSVVMGHPNLLNQLITNLVVNAIQYNRDGGTVHLDVRTDTSEVVLDVQDNGIGIPANDMQHLFERFYRVDQARSRNTGGNGLGLAICKRIVEIHRGSIEVQSTVGEGSTFSVRLPKAAHVATISDRRHEKGS